jgi:hypothetical protein
MTAKVFKLHWGSGVVAEEARIDGDYKSPTIQLLEFTDGEAKGQSQIRFCHYSRNGAFQRSPLILDLAEIPQLRKAIRKCPKLRRLLARLV